MNDRLVNLADGLMLAVDERLAPSGVSIPEHFLLVARTLYDAEVALAALEIEPGPFTVDNAAVRRSDASFALLEAARAYMGFAIRLRARLTGQHSDRAAEPLRAGLHSLAMAAPAAEPAELLATVERALVLSARAADIASLAEQARLIGVSADEPIHQLVSHGVLALLQLTAQVQGGDQP